MIAEGKFAVAIHRSDSIKSSACLATIKLRGRARGKPAATDGPSYSQTERRTDLLPRFSDEADFIAKPWRTSSTAC